MFPQRLRWVGGLAALCLPILGSLGCNDATPAGPGADANDAAAASDGDGNAARDASAGALRVPELPAVPPLPEWKDNPSSDAKKELGRAIFHDRRLSGSGRSNCMGCHTPFLHFQDALPLSVPDRSFPDDRPTLHRHTPTLLNLVYAPVSRWDASHTDLVEVLAFPFAEANMNLSEGIPASDPISTDIPSAKKNLRKRFVVDFPGYVELFQEAFGVDIAQASRTKIWKMTGKALAIYLRGAVSQNAPFDRWNAGDDRAMNAEAVRGLALFRGKGKCVACHGGPFFSDFALHNVSSELPDKDGHRHDEGGYLTTGEERFRGAFLTPSLRSIWYTAPYFHNGSQPSLRSLVAHLTGADARKDPLHDPIFDDVKKLSEDEVEDLMAFMKALTGEYVTGLDAPATFPE